MERKFSCFFTGHRIIAGDRRKFIIKELRSKIRMLIEDKGVTDFIAGGALGFDMMAEKAIIELKEEYDYINLHLYLPCYNNTQNWNESHKKMEKLIMAHSNVIYVTESDYIDGCMQKRNRKMADDALYCISYCAHSKSGTHSAVAYAKKIGCITYNIDI